MRDTVTAELLRRHFATAQAPESSVYGDERDEGARAGGPDFKPAAVLVPIIAHAEALTLLLTKRAAHLKFHPGQVSFPGGRVDSGDSGPEETALREAWEEIGLPRERVELIGRLPEYVTGTNYRITPVVGLLTPPLAFRPDPAEVDEVFEIPLALVLDPANHRRDAREWQGRKRQFFVIPHDQHYIWGATAGMLVNLYRHLAQGRLAAP